ncbi:aminotransferase [Pseudomonas abyssi]|uniref:Aminotransferase n=1 Tax=Pseudomonas abyssi TaxID=170540 RepID=A0A2A3MHX4_9PSED|nr:aminotransferase class V-fold PLP-dependent enzyme [Pseudomonas abyssi]MAC99552.1 aminotransferase class V-fold PLP-dependent enzyme [Pseudomonadales bacterium]PBK04381.1 aminotransferase [Pseudomonas abyssi]|tara:strand:+ start:11901 stop:13064 length:1164 start_codon:yes stop_codon:yes gene_type:complete
MIDDHRWQAEFPQANGLCYLNHAAVAPWPKRAAEAVSAFASENLQQGAQDYPRWSRGERQLRDQLRTLLNAPHSDDIALVKNTSEALSFVAQGVDWQPGDQVIISNQEFPSNRLPWEALAGRGVEVIAVDLGSEPEQALIDAMGPRTRLLSISSVQYGTGLRLDLQQLGTACRARGVLFCVDAIQTLGAQPFDVQQIDCDFAMADGHKWLLAPEGLGVFFCHARVRDQLQLTQHGWHMVEAIGDYDRSDWHPARSARRFEAGSPNTLAQQAMSASLSLLLEADMPWVAAQLDARICLLAERLQALPGVQVLSDMRPGRRSGIITFSVAGQDHKALHKALMDRGVVCALRGGGIRWSPHFYTPQSTLESALARLAELINQTSNNNPSR